MSAKEIMEAKKIMDRIIETFPNEFDKNWIENLNEIYLELDKDNVRNICIYLYEKLNLPLITMFASDERSLNGNFIVNYTFADREKGVLITLRSKIDRKKPEYKSITDRVHGAALYEREIKDMFGLEPEGHPDPKPIIFHSNWPDGNYPLRKDFDRNARVEFANREIHFKRVGGEGVFEIPVGPVHAGIIEPGHFRFSVAGDPIINLEAQLGFVHKGIEKLFEGSSIEKGLYISERISGDETFSNSLAYCLAVEKIGGIVVPVRAEYTRVVFAELERLTSHLNDLAGICLDVAYGFACFQFRMMRAWSYLIADELCGMRFLRSVNKPGGVRKDFISGKEKSVILQLRKIEKEVTDTWEIIRGNTMFADRVENTGIVKNEIAKDLNAVGPAGRAAGVNFDVRKNFPYGAYKEMEFSIPEFSDGDVNARMKIKLKECHESITIMIQALETISGTEYLESIGELEPYKMAYGITEAPRGENVHFLMTGENNTIYRYKVRTPSFCNWPIVCHAVQGNVVPDFPVINKSFNLSYAGNDL